VPNAQDAGQDRSGIDPAELCPRQESMVDTLDQIKARTVIPPRVRGAAPAAAPVGVVQKVSILGSTGK